MKNKTIAYWLAAVLGLAILGGMLDASDDFFTVVGLGMLAFGGFATHRLYNLAD